MMTSFVDGRADPTQHATELLQCSFVQAKKSTSLRYILDDGRAEKCVSIKDMLHGVMQQLHQKVLPIDNQIRDNNASNFIKLFTNHRTKRIRAKECLERVKDFMRDKKWDFSVQELIQDAVDKDLELFMMYFMEIAEKNTDRE
jgi:hypothetical protein